MRRHMAIHKNDRKFKCWICNYNTDRKDFLKSHCKNKHNMNEDQYFRRVDELGINLYPKNGRPKKD